MPCQLLLIEVPGQHGTGFKRFTELDFQNFHPWLDIREAVPAFEDQADGICFRRKVQRLPDDTGNPVVLTVQVIHRRIRRGVCGEGICVWQHGIRIDDAQGIFFQCLQVGLPVTVNVETILQERINRRPCDGHRVQCDRHRQGEIFLMRIQTGGTVQFFSDGDGPAVLLRNRECETGDGAADCIRQDI